MGRRCRGRACGRFRNGGRARRRRGSSRRNTGRGRSPPQRGYQAFLSCRRQLYGCQICSACPLPAHPGCPVGGHRQLSCADPRGRACRQRSAGPGGYPVLGWRPADVCSAELTPRRSSVSKYRQRLSDHAAQWQKHPVMAVCCRPCKSESGTGDGKHGDHKHRHRPPPFPGRNS